MILQGYEMGGEQLLLRYPNNTGSPGSQPLATASFLGKKKQLEGWAISRGFICLSDQREWLLYFSQSNICFVFVLFFLVFCIDPRVSVFVCLMISIFVRLSFSKVVCLLVCQSVCLVCLSAWMLNSAPQSPRFSWSVNFVGMDYTDSKFLSTRTNFACPFDAFCSSDLKQSMNKLSGPVNGDECYFWRTTGCYFADKCRFRHVPESKGVDLKRVEAKYGGKLRVTTPPTEWKNNNNNINNDS